MSARTNRPDEQSEQEPQKTQHGWVIPKKTWWRSRQMRLERSAGSPALFTVNNRPHPAQIIQFYTQKSKQDLLLICLILKQILIMASDNSISATSLVYRMVA